MLIDRIAQELKDAMKAREEQRVSTLRMLSSALKNKKIELQHELTEEEVLAVIQKQLKGLTDAAVQFEAGGRADLATQAHAEIVILTPYVPAQMSDEELEVCVKKIIAQTGASSKSDMGKIMGALMPVIAGRADGARARALVEKHLG